jgi:DNA-binding CsgD family transcriptional regulator
MEERRPLNAVKRVSRSNLTILLFMALQRPVNVVYCRSFHLRFQRMRRVGAGMVRQVTPMDVALLLWLEELYAAVGNAAVWPCLSALRAPVRDIPADSPVVLRLRANAERLHVRLLDMSARLEAFARVLDQLPHPVIVVDVTLRVLIVQQRARLILERADGLSLNGETLVTARPDTTRKLRECVAQVFASANRVSLLLERATGLSGVPVVVLPLPRAAAPCEFPPAAMVVIADPDCTGPTDQQALQQIYGLTRAEAQVAAMLLKGRSLEEAANELCVSLNTVRTHLQRIFSKTDTARQSQLLRTLLLGPAGLP